MERTSGSQIDQVWSKVFPLKTIMDWFVSEHFTAGPDQKIIGYDWFQNETGLVAFQVAVETAKPEPEPEPSGEIPEPDIDYIVDDLMTHPTKVYDTRARTAIKGIVIHHTATDPSVGPHRCAEWHVEKNDWAGIGYHFVVDPDGVIYQTNRLETVSAQAASVNGSTIGVCFQGNFQEVVPTEAQIQAGAHLIAYLQQGLFIETENVKGHREHMATACPGNQWLSGKKWKNLLMAEIARVKEEYIQ